MRPLEFDHASYGMGGPEKLLVEGSRVQRKIRVKATGYRQLLYKSDCNDTPQSRFTNLEDNLRLAFL